MVINYTYWIVLVELRPALTKCISTKIGKYDTNFATSHLQHAVLRNIRNYTWTATRNHTKLHYSAATVCDPCHWVVTTVTASGDTRYPESWFGGWPSVENSRQTGMLAVVALHNTFLHFDQFGLTFIVNSKLSFDLILQILTYFLILLYQLLNLMRIFFALIK